jgi:N-acetyl-1-D-myo-inositol-2-amino-2-deoxy-alpha-D-glucopyranoside deacetylase
MAGDPANDHPRAFVRGALDAQVACLREIIDEVRPQVVVSYAADGGYGHPDHIRAHEVTVAAATEVARVFYTVQSRRATESGVAALADLPYRLPAPGELPVVDDETITTVIDISDRLPAKLRAMRAHATQITVWEDRAYALSNLVAQPVLPHEYFRLASGRPDGAETDLFGGLAGVS